jgi:hypothetical protein
MTELHKALFDAVSTIFAVHKHPIKNVSGKNVYLMALPASSPEIFGM